jgi:hypothetical protein
MNPEVINKYEFTIRPGRYVFPKFGEIDLFSLNLKKADELFNKGFRWMKLRKAGSEPPAGKSKTKKSKIG